MVERINRISRSDASAPTDVGHTLNIGSDAENAWVAARQSQINHDIEERQRKMLEERERRGTLDDEQSTDDPDTPSRQWVEATGTDVPTEGEADEPRLSGESERIGTQNFDEDTPFGNRVAIV